MHKIRLEVINDDAEVAYDLEFLTDTSYRHLLALGNIHFQTHSIDILILELQCSSVFAISRLSADPVREITFTLSLYSNQTSRTIVQIEVPLIVDLFIPPLFIEALVCPSGLTHIAFFSIKLKALHLFIDRINRPVVGPYDVIALVELSEELATSWTLRLCQIISGRM